jgi:hypothetical protein
MITLELTNEQIELLQTVLNAAIKERRETLTVFDAAESHPLTISALEWQLVNLRAMRDVITAQTSGPVT